MIEHFEKLCSITSGVIPTLGNSDDFLLATVRSEAASAAGNSLFLKILVNPTD